MSCLHQEKYILTLIGYRKTVNINLTQHSAGIELRKVQK